MVYIGRFAPTPSGELHFGSLVTALGSYLQAKKAKGKWLVRIEDIDQTRTIPSATNSILKTLNHFGLFWDDEIIYQSQRQAIYLECLMLLKQNDHIYPCECTRKRIKQLGHYDSHCRTNPLSKHKNYSHITLRFRQSKPVYSFYDQRLGWYSINPQIAMEDFILKRKDGFFSYNFAVVIDDYLQNITEIVRGEDLLSVTGWQLSLYKQFNWSIPNYFHLPLVTDSNGLKLSKQNRAPSLNKHYVPTLAKALQFLGQTLPEQWQYASIPELLKYACQHWKPEKITTN